MRPCLYVLLLTWHLSNLIQALGDVGTAASYDPPYLPTKCSGYSEDQFPEDGYFASVSDCLWDNGAACGRRYRVSCISGPNRPCKDGYVIATVVDLCRKSPCPVTMALSNRAYTALSRSSRAKINIEYSQI